MNSIVVFGPGCSGCNEAEENVRRAVAECGVEARITKVTDHMSLSALRITVTPAVAINGNIRVTGRVPSVQEIRGWLKGCPRDSTCGRSVAGTEGGVP